MNLKTKDIMSLIIQNKNIMKISNNCLVMVFLLLITGCDNKRLY